MLNARDFVEAELYDSEEAVIEDALRSLIQLKPQLRLAIAVHRFQREDLSVARAAALAGVSFEQMKHVLAERGIPLRFGVETIEEAHDDLASVRRMLS